MITRSAAAAVVCLAPALAWSHPVPCGPTMMMLQQLRQVAKEKPIGNGQAGPNAAQFWLSAAGTWTVTISTANGITCIVAAGVDWEMLPTGDPA